MLHLLRLSVCLVCFIAGDWGKENRFVMKAPGPHCPALLMGKPGDVKEVARVDQGCCRREQREAEVGGSAEELCVAQRVWCGWLCPAVRPH